MIVEISDVLEVDDKLSVSTALFEIFHVKDSIQLFSHNRHGPKFGGLYPFGGGGLCPI